MAPPKPRGAIEKRAAVNKRMEILRARERADDKKKIEELEALLDKPDEDLEKMDIDVEDVDDDEREASASGNTNTPNGEQGEGSTPANPPATTVPAQGEGDTRPTVGANEPAGTGTGQEGAGQSQRDDNSSQPQVKTEEADDGNSLFVPENGAESGLEDDHEVPLFAIPVSGASSEVTTVAWGSGRSERFINRYGKPGCMRYRLNDYESEGYEKSPAQDFREQALGHLTDGRKHRYGKRDFTGRIWGVAWSGDGSKADLDLIDPKKAGKRRDKGGIMSGELWPETHVLVEWKGDLGKRWETRTTLRRLWKSKDADKRVFTAATEAETRYGAAKTERGYTRAPSEALFRGSVSRSPSPGPNGAVDKSAEMAKYKESYCELLGKAFSALSIDEMRQCTEGWMARKEILGI